MRAPASRFPGSATTPDRYSGTVTLGVTYPGGSVDARAVPAQARPGRRMGVVATFVSPSFARFLPYASVRYGGRQSRRRVCRNAENGNS
jgi:hypothetical protein